MVLQWGQLVNELIVYVLVLGNGINLYIILLATSYDLVHNIGLLLAFLQAGQLSRQLLAPDSFEELPIVIPGSIGLHLQGD